MYDGDRSLVKKIKPDGSKTIYVGGLYEVDKNSGGTVTKTTVYYPLANAMRVNGTLYYMLKDHLGSASVVTDSTGAIVGETRYYPFGETRLTTGTLYTDKLFTGQREITGLGIYHYGARFYSPKLGRFLSADSLVPSYANPQHLNRFGYVLNNPLRYTDPSGHICVESGGSNGEFAMAGKCNGKSNPNYKPGLQGSPSGWTHKSKPRKDKDDDTPTPPLTTTPPPDPGVTPVTTATPSPTVTQSSTNTDIDVTQFLEGAALFAVGLGVAIIGGILIGVAIAEVVGGVATGPFEALVALHALAVGGAGLGFALIGVATMRKGYEKMKSSLTP